MNISAQTSFFLSEWMSFESNNFKKLEEFSNNKSKKKRGSKHKLFVRCPQCYKWRQVDNRNPELLLFVSQIDMYWNKHGRMIF